MPSKYIEKEQKKKPQVRQHPWPLAISGFWDDTCYHFCTLQDTVLLVYTHSKQVVHFFNSEVNI